MATLHRSVDISAPADRVWSLLEDVRRLPEFSPGTTEVRDAPAVLTAPGQTYVQVGRLFGATYSSSWTVVEIDPGTRIVSDGTVLPGVGYRLTQQLTPLGADRCRLEITVDYRVPGGPVGRLAARAGIEGRAGRESQQVLDGIKRVVEAVQAG